MAGHCTTVCGYPNLNLRLRKAGHSYTQTPVSLHELVGLSLNLENIKFPF